MLERIDHAERHHQHGQQHERQRDAVYAHDVAAVDHIYPRAIYHELKTACVVQVEPCQQQHSHHCRCQRGQQSHCLLHLFVGFGDGHHQ